jgi:colanic acid/amylovoran biosynthesis glycosyltransferase
VHHSALNLDEFPFRGRSLPPHGPIKLLCIARLVEVKGVRYAIEAVRVLRDKGIDIDLHVLGDGPLRGECQSRIAASKLGGRIVLEGDCPKSRVRSFLEDSHILVCPSVIGSDGAQEGMPNAVKEAMACGLPVVATDTGGIPELIQDGVTGLIVPEKNAAAIAAAIERLIRRPESWAPLCENARRVIEDEFDSRRLNDRLVGLYQDLVGNTVPAGSERSGQPVCERDPSQPVVERP